MNNENQNRTESNDGIEYIPEKSILLPVPALSRNIRPPAFIHTIELVITGTETEAVRFVIKRDLSLKIKDFTVRYRFSSLPIYATDPEHVFRSFTYDGEDINEDPDIALTAGVSSATTSTGCNAYISEVTLESGQILTYDAAEYQFVRRPRIRAIHTPPTSAAESNENTSGAERLSDFTHQPYQSPSETAPVQSCCTAEIKQRKHKRLTVILCALLLTIAVEAIAGVCLYRYMGVKNSTDVLMKDKRYNEAYKLALDSGYESLLQRVCEKAAVYYNSIGDLESAYVYSYGAPEKFTDTVIEYAAQNVVSMLSGEINENAFIVAKMSENDLVFDVIIHSMLNILTERGDFANAIRVASEMRNETDREATEASLFISALDYYAKANRYNSAITFINEIESIPTFDIAKEDCIISAIRHFASIGDSAGMIYLAHAYPEVTVELQQNITVEPDDAGVRTELAIVYPMLTAQQKRSFHSQSLAIWNNKVLQIKNNELSVGDKTYKNVVSVDASEDYTLVLHENGSVSLTANTNTAAVYSIPSFNDVVGIAQGEAHSVLLHADGSVTVHGSNDHGQANVSAWTDIAAVAAGQCFTLGLRLDGTVVAAGSDSAGQCNVSAYRNVVDIAACSQTSVLLFSDGTVKLEGYRSLGLSDVESLSDVTRIRAGGASIVAEHSEGEYITFTGSFGGNGGSSYNWRRIKAFDVGMMCIAGVDEDGILYLDGDGIGG